MRLTIKREAMESVGIPFAALLLSLLVFGAFILAVGVDPIGVYRSMFRGAFGTWFSWQNTLVGAAPLMLTALCTALPARMGLINIGAEGAFVVGGLLAALVALGFTGAPGVVGLGAMLLTGIVSGGLWIAMVGALKHYRGVNETISSLLLNYIAIAVLDFLVVGPLRDPASLNNPGTYPIDSAFQISDIGNSSVHWGLIISLVVCVGLWIAMRFTTFGFSVDVTGGNRRAAQLAGMSVGKLVLATCFLGGGAAGLAGSIEIAAVQGAANTALNAGYGYQGILIAFIARHNPIAIIPVAILLGGIHAAGGLVQRVYNLPDATDLVLQGIIFIIILGSEAMYGRLRLPLRWRTA